MIKNKAAVLSYERSDSWFIYLKKAISLPPLLASHKTFDKHLKSQHLAIF